MIKYTVTLADDTSLYPFVSITDSPTAAARAFCVYHYDILSLVESNILTVTDTATGIQTKVSVTINLDIQTI